VRIPIDPDGAAGGLFSGLLHLQTDFYTRLTQETLRYLRRLQGAVAPAVPGTVLMPGPEAGLELNASGSPGASVELNLEIENRQRVHCVVTPALSPLVGASGVTWFPPADALPPLLLLAPDEIATLVVKLPLPTNIPSGAYHGALLLQGLHHGAVPVAITVTGVTPDSVAAAATPASTPAPKPRRARKAAEKKTAASRRSPRTSRRAP
jgi:hypothetical protein